jgi:hypothetical protein
LVRYTDMVCSRLSLATSSISASLQACTTTYIYSLMVGNPEPLS